MEKKSKNRGKTKKRFEISKIDISILLMVTECQQGEQQKKNIKFNCERKLYTQRQEIEHRLETIDDW